MALGNKTVVLEELYNHEKGYVPLVLTKDWQVAQLNYTPAQAPENLRMLDQHTFTDETFILFQGRAVLLTYNQDTGERSVMSLKPGYTYNVPAMMWHNIAMEENSIVMIMENRDAHIKGFRQIGLPDALKQEIIEYTNIVWRTPKDI